MTILFVLLLLVLASAFFSLAEISLAASRRLRLEMLAKEGNAAAKRILHLQDQPGHYFTVVQIGLNGVAILAGAVGNPRSLPRSNRLPPSCSHLNTPARSPPRLPFSP